MSIAGSTNKAYLLFEDVKVHMETLKDVDKSNYLFNLSLHFAYCCLEEGSKLKNMSISDLSLSYIQILIEVLISYNSNALKIKELQK